MTPQRSRHQLHRILDLLERTAPAGRWPEWYPGMTEIDIAPPFPEAGGRVVFKVKSAFTEPDDLPAQDCTAVLFDMDSKVLRLAGK